MQYTSVSTPDELQAYCRRLASVSQIAFDTEFVAERSYRPQLCLIQVAADNELALVDALGIDDLTPFWHALLAPGREIVVHAGRGELEFCYRATGTLPDRLFDVQVAAGLVGIEYPVGYANLMTRLLGETPAKHETRTDWSRRPLSHRQIQYALDDIRYLPRIREKLHARLVELGRLAWLEDEMAAWRGELTWSLSGERWRRISGNTGLNGRALAILRELWRWREAEAQRRDCPVRHVLRDDLLVELARRQSADIKRIRAVRGLERGDLQRQLPKIAEAIRRGLAVAPEDLPGATRSEVTPQLAVLGQLLFAVLGTICRGQSLAPGLVGTPNDVREWIACRLGLSRGTRPPLLSRGWRAEVVGNVFDELLQGRLAVRVGDPASEAPLILEPPGAGR